VRSLPALELSRNQGTGTGLRSQPGCCINEHQTVLVSPLLKRPRREVDLIQSTVVDPSAL